jgi:Tol biopolymer transport system component
LPGDPRIDRLAYLAPDTRSSWYTGVLMIADGPDFQTRREVAPNILTTGDLTWSPDGETLAFLAFRPDENVYTVMTVAQDGSDLTDLFPTDLARTDARTSQKAIIGWKNDDTLQVITSCGEECRQSYNIRINAASGGAAGPVLTPTPVANYRDLGESLQIHQSAITATAIPLPKNLYSPNWSPNEQWIAYLDRRGILYALSLDEKILYPLDIGLRTVYETQWSPLSDHIAIRAEDRIFVFELECSDSASKP